LTLRSRAVRVRLGQLALALPALLRPRDYTVVAAEGVLARVRVAIELPVIGPLLTYDGIVEEIL
jgi:hypothetical protein